jgi:hypothetical protein
MVQNPVLPTNDKIKVHGNKKITSISKIKNKIATIQKLTSN